MSTILDHLFAPAPASITVTLSIALGALSTWAMIVANTLAVRASTIDPYSIFQFPPGYGVGQTSLDPRDDFKRLQIDKAAVECWQRYWTSLNALGTLGVVFLGCATATQEFGLVFMAMGLLCTVGLGVRAIAVRKELATIATLYGSSPTVRGD